MKAPLRGEGGASTGVWERVAWVSFCGALFVVPVATTNLSGLGVGSSPFFSNDVESAKAAALYVLAGLALLGWGLSRGRVRTPRALWLAPAAVAWMLASALGSQRPALAVFGDVLRFEGVVTWACYFTLAFLGLQLVDSAARTRTVMRVVVCAGVLESAWGLAQTAGVDRTDWGPLGFEAHRAFGTFGNPDMLAGFLVLCLPLALTLALDSETVLATAFSWGCAALIATALLTTFVRGAWIAALVATAALGVVLALQRRGLRSADLAGAAFAVLAVAAAGFVSGRSASAVTNAGTRLASMASLSSGSAGTRLLIWRSALGAIAASPVFGYGTECFPFAFARFRPTAFIKTAGALELVDNAHDLPLQLAATMGVVGAALVLGLVVTALVIDVRAALRGRGSARSGLAMAYAGLAAAILGYLTHLLFGVSVIGSSAVFWAIVGVSLVSAPRMAETTPRRVLRPIAASAAASALLLLAVSSSLAEVEASRSFEAKDAASRVELAEAALTAAPYRDAYLRQVGLARASAMSSELRQAVAQASAHADTAGSIAAGREYYRTSRDALDRYATGRRYDVDAWAALVGLDLQYAEAFSDRASYGLAAETARGALALLPDDPILLTRLGRAELGGGDRQAAASSARRALAEDPAYADATDLLQKATAPPAK